MNALLLLRLRVVVAFATLLLFPVIASAGVVINTVTVNPASVVPGGNISVTVNATTSGGGGVNNWFSTNIALTKTGQTDVTLYCQSNPSYTDSGTYTVTFPGLAVPGAIAGGAWTVRVRAFNTSGACANTPTLGNDSTNTSQTLTILAANTPPVATNNAYTTNEDTALTTGNVITDNTGSGVDSDANGDPLTAIKVSDPAYGALTLNGNGTFSYNPALNYCGPDSFTYKVNDGLADSNVATVSLTVTCVNDAPSFTAHNSSVAEDAGAQSGVVVGDAFSPGPANESAQTLADCVVTGLSVPVGLLSGGPTVSVSGSACHLAYTPAADANGSFSFNLAVRDSGSGTPPNVNLSGAQLVTITITPVNDKPDFAVVTPINVPEDNNGTGANNDVAVTTNFYSGAANETQTVIACQLQNFSDGNTPAVVTSAPSVEVNAGANGCQVDFTTQLNNYGSFGFEVRLQDSGGTPGVDWSDWKAVTITVDNVNDPPYVESVSLASQSTQYSDDIDTVTVLVRDIDSPFGDLGLSRSGQPSAIGGMVQNGPCQAWDGSGYTLSGSECTFTMDGQVLVPGDALYNIVFTPSDASSDGTKTGTHALSVIPEDATVRLDDGNPVAALGADATGNLQPIVMHFTAWETNDVDSPMPDGADLPLPNANANAGADDFVTDPPFSVLGSMTLSPVGPGGPQTVACVKYDEGGSRPYGEWLTFECTFPSGTVGVNVYEVMAKVDGAAGNRYFAGLDEDAIVVFDPTLGFTTGGGWFYWPGTEIDACLEYDTEEPYGCIVPNPDPCAGHPGDRTNFGYVMKYNKKANKVQGSALVMRHVVEAVDDVCLDAGAYRVKSNALYGLALGTGDKGQPTEYGWASFAGKATYREPNLDNEGNHLFFIYAEDHGGQGCNPVPADRFWVEVWDRNDAVVMLPPMGPTAYADAVDVQCGNVYVPHANGPNP